MFRHRINHSSVHRKSYDFNNPDKIVFFQPRVKFPCLECAPSQRFGSSTHMENTALVWAGRGGGSVILYYTPFIFDGWSMDDKYERG